MRRALISCLMLICGARLVSAQSDGPSARVGPDADASAVGYALVIGSNVGGPGQQPLRFAERDAEKVASALVDVGRFMPDHVTRVLRPSRQAVVSSLAAVDAAMRADQVLGRSSLLFVYYSGHARAQALNLGSDLLELAELREQVLRTSAALKIVVLDACQSGAFSRAKGAEATADFSYNSVEQLRTAGIVVMASSSESELSQESEILQASYFTHHLLVALRGAGDANLDGQVTLAETYQYAYNRTLASTAETAIGGQHVTLETSLRGEGEVALGYPARADARLLLDPALAADLVITSLPSRSVVAEVHKIADHGMVLALPAGRYYALVRRSGATRRCDVLLTVGLATTLATASCEAVHEFTAVAKGSSVVEATELWSVEVGVGLGGHRDDAFATTLGEFGYGDNGNHLGRVAVAGTYALTPTLSIGTRLANLDARRYARDTQDVVQGFEWYSYALGAFARAQPAWRTIVPYVEAGAGLSLARSALDEIVVTDTTFVPAPGSDELPPVERVSRVEWHTGGNLGLAAGIQIMPWERFGFFTHFSWTYAPTIANRLGDTHDVGGITLLIGARLRATEAR